MTAPKFPFLEVPAAGGLGKQQSTKHNTPKPCRAFQPAECSSLVFGQQSQKADVTLCSFLSLAPGPLAGFEQLLASLSSWAAKLLPSLTQCQAEQPLSLNPCSFVLWILAAFSSTPPAQTWHSPLLAQAGMCPCCSKNADEK